MPIVGVGASAGGLEAFSQLLRALPAEPGIALIFIQHLAPHHESALQVLLSAQTPMRVVEAAEGMAVKADQVHVIPPNVQMCLRDGHLQLVPRPSDRTQYTPIDVFLRSLAEVAQEDGIAVILSGTASDGAAGVRDVKAAGGITIAQSPESAKYDGMPRAAIATGTIDLVLDPAGIADELVRIAKHNAELPPLATAETPEAATPQPPDASLERIFAILRNTTGVDFKRYKLATLERRIHRRMILHRLTRLDRYVTFLETNQGEVQALYRDIFIHVTRFFREPESFAALASEVLPRILERRSADEPVRIWVSGCATGEEAYSVAITLVEVLGDKAGSTPVQVFATDISEAAIEHARAGLYPDAISADVSADRLARFFTKSDGGYRITKGIRDLCVFARQDLTRDPPFSKVDLVLCRNVLIYLGPELQKRLLAVFHYAIKPSGFLMLGHAETTGANADAFTTVDRKHRIYQRKATVAPALGLAAGYARPSVSASRLSVATVAAATRSVQTEANRIIQDRYAPPGVVVDSDFQIVQYRGHTGPYLEPAPGDPSLSVLKMAREGLLDGLRAVLQEARKTRRAARKQALRMRYDGGWRKVAVEAIPIEAGSDRHYLVLFDDAAVRGRERRPEPVDGRRPPAASTVGRLEKELASSREYLQSIIQELEAANEELQSANEEILSSNEELQSTNEELDTAKEELQSSNEELNTVNDELSARNEELARANSDLLNLLANVQIAIVIVTNDLRIRRFTPMAERILNLIPADVGRPIGHIKPNIDCPDLEQLITEVIETVAVRERHVRDRQGNALVLRVRPYKDTESRIDGVVLTLFEIDGAKGDADELRTASGYADALVRTVREPVVVLDEACRIRFVNQAFLDRFGVARADVEQRRIYDIAGGRWDVPALHALLERDLVSSDAVAGVALSIQPGDRGPSQLVVNAARVPATPEHELRSVLAIADAPAPRGDKRGKR